MICMTDLWDEQFGVYIFSVRLESADVCRDRMVIRLRMGKGRVNRTPLKGSCL